MGTDGPSETELDEEDVLLMMLDCEKEHGRCKPRLFDHNESYCSIQDVIDVFGSWMEAMKALERRRSELEDESMCAGVLFSFVVYSWGSGFGDESVAIASHAIHVLRMIV